MGQKRKIDPNVKCKRRGNEGLSKVQDMASGYVHEIDVWVSGISAGQELRAK